MYLTLPASGNFCNLLIAFANSLDLDLARQNVGPDLDQNCLTPWWYWKIQHPKSKIWHNNKEWRNNKSNIGKSADQNTLFRKYVIFEPPSMYF